MKRALAAAHLLLISPAVLFLVAVVVQGMQSLQKGLHTLRTISSCGTPRGCGRCGYCYLLYLFRS